MSRCTNFYASGLAKTMLGSVEFLSDGIRFTDYPYPPASIYPTGIVKYLSIEEIVINAIPPEVRTSEDILFVSASLREQLMTVAKEQGIALTNRQDVWGLILEPFLDTEFTAAQQQATLELLEQNGIDRELSKRLRNRVAKAMWAYNFDSGLWDWCHLGLSDLLSALQGTLSGPEHCLPKEQFAAFYREAIKLAHQGKLLNI
ncbi:MAG: hypothetical protein AB1489_13205 [Acidobacteriota bacterium]